MNLNEQTIAGTLEPVAVAHPDVPKQACLMLVDEQHLGQMHAFRGPEMLIGRSPRCHIYVRDPSISRRHAKLVETVDGIEIVDLDSTNGTYVNGVPVRRHRLADGDKLQLGKAILMKFSFKDQIEQQFQKRLLESAMRDGLTRAYNKQYFLQQLAMEVDHAVRSGTALGLLIFDLDHFKEINDTHGHPGGDAVLRLVARGVQAILRPSDLLARYGGEEFAIIARGATCTDALCLGERVRRTIEADAFPHEGKSLRVTASVGVAAVEGGRITDVEELIKAADDCLYAAKRRGRNMVCCTDHLMKAL